MTQQQDSQRPVYQGRGELGDQLRRMLTDGKQVIQKERGRLQINRAFYMGNQYLQPVSGVGLRQLAPTHRLRSGRIRATINRLRQFTDGRVVMLTREVPPYEVVPESTDHDEYTAARLAEKYVGYEWGNPEGWNIHHHRRRLAIAAEQDGVAFWNVTYDPAAGPQSKEPVPMAPGPNGQWQPVTDRAHLESLIAQDPNAESLWRMVPVPMGDVVHRVVRLGKLSIDPGVTTDWRRCRWIIESDVWPVEKLERIAGRRLEELRSDSRAALRSAGDVSPATVGIEDGYEERQVPGANNALVHKAYVAPQGPGTDFPDGAEVLWADIAPGAPFIVRPWARPVPYYPYVPRPDELHILRSRGTVDELRPIQISFNRTVSSIEEWLAKLARPPLILNGGSIRDGKPVFNEEGFLITNPGFSDPHFMVVPGEPTAIMNNWLGFLMEQMAEISVQQDIARGTPVGGDTSGVALDLYSRNNETQLSGAEGELRRVTEWAINEALYLVAHHFTAERIVTLPGANGQDEVLAFRGEQLRGGCKFRITGSTLPRSKEQQRQVLMELVAATGGRFDISRHIPELVDGDIDMVTKRVRAQADRQASENRSILALGRHPLRDQIWASFVQQRDMFIAAVQAAAADDMVADPMVFLQSQGIQPPRLTDMLRRVAVQQGQVKQEAMTVPGLPASNGENWPDPPDVPTVQEFDDPVEHITALDDVCLSDGYDQFHDLVKQLLREHREDHLKQLARQAEPEMGAPEGQPEEQGAPA